MDVIFKAMINHYIYYFNITIASSVVYKNKEDILRKA